MEFHTGLFALDYVHYPKFPYRGNGWKLSLLGPSKGQLPTASMHYRGGSYPAKEVLIDAPSEERAQRAADLINSALLRI